VTTTFTAPAARAGATTVTDVEVFDEIEVPAVPPKVTLVTPSRFVPVIVTEVPADKTPDEGEIDVIVGLFAPKDPGVTESD
jgi:hypothetical protein